MTTADIVNAAPWRLPAPRAFDAYEEAIVLEAVVDGMASVVLPNMPNVKMADLVPAAQSLVRAMAQSNCSAFKASFGPSPAVNMPFFTCIGRGYAATFANPPVLLDPSSQQRFLNDIATSTLCGPNGYLSPCADPNFIVNSLFPPLVLQAAQAQGIEIPQINPGEGLPQWTTYAPIPSSLVAQVRARTAYQLTTGQKLLAVIQQMQRAGVALPPNVQQLITLANNPLAAPFMTREFLLAVSLKQNIDVTQALLAVLTVFRTGQPTQADLINIANLLIDDVVAVWAPGQGFSVLPFILGNADIGQLIALLLGLGLGNPSVSPLPQIIPGLPPEIQTQIGGLLGGILGALGGAPVQQRVTRSLKTASAGTGTKATILAQAAPKFQLSGPGDTSLLTTTPYTQLVTMPAPVPDLPVGTPVVRTPVAQLPLTLELQSQGITVPGVPAVPLECLMLPPCPPGKIYAKDWAGQCICVALDPNIIPTNLCAPGTVPTWNGSTWECKQVTGPTPSVPDGLFCAPGTVPTWNGSAWECKAAPLPQPPAPSSGGGGSDDNTPMLLAIGAAVIVGGVLIFGGKNK